MISQTNQSQASQMSEATKTRIATRIADAQRNEDDDYGNPEYVFSLTHNDLLLAIAGGLVDPIALAKKQLANRGLDGNGKWIGFDAAARAWEVER